MLPHFDTPSFLNAVNFLNGVYNLLITLSNCSARERYETHPKYWVISSSSWVNLSLNSTKPLNLTTLGCYMLTLSLISRSFFLNASRKKLILFSLFEIKAFLFGFSKIFDVFTDDKTSSKNGDFFDFFKFFFVILKKIVWCFWPRSKLPCKEITKVVRLKFDKNFLNCINLSWIQRD